MMAINKRETDQKYIEEQMAEAQQNYAYDEGDIVPAEQYSKPESMHKRSTSHKGSKSQTQGYKG